MQRQTTAHSKLVISTIYTGCYSQWNRQCDWHERQALVEDLVEPHILELVLQIRLVFS
jgi:hypothetical protein